MNSGAETPWWFALLEIYGPMAMVLGFLGWILRYDLLPFWKKRIELKDQAIAKESERLVEQLEKQDTRHAAAWDKQRAFYDGMLSDQRRFFAEALGDMKELLKHVVKNQNRQMGLLIAHDERTTTPPEGKKEKSYKELINRAQQLSGETFGDISTQSPDKPDGSRS